MEAVEPVYVFDPGTRGFTCSVEEKIFRFRQVSKPQSLQHCAYLGRGMLLSLLFSTGSSDVDGRPETCLYFVAENSSQSWDFRQAMDSCVPLRA